MITRIVVILLTISVMVPFGCKKLEESGITIDKAITVLEYAKTAKTMIDAGNANSIADQLLKEVDNDKDTDVEIEEEEGEE